MAPTPRLVSPLAPRLGRTAPTMSALLVAAFVLGASASAATAAALCRRWAEHHHWRRIRLEATRVDILCAECDHLRRHNRRLTDEQEELREGVGDLLDTVAAKDATIARLRPRRSPVPVYGITRSPAWRALALRGRDTT